MNVSIGLAFLAGMASFLSPCVFSLVPAYIGYLSGRSMASTDGTIEGDKRLTALLHGLMFVLGFSVVFVTLGLAASAIGALLNDLSYYLAKIGGLVVVIFGLHMTGILRIKFLEYDLRPQSIQQKRQGFPEFIPDGSVFFCWMVALCGTGTGGHFNLCIEWWRFIEGSDSTHLLFLGIRNPIPDCRTRYWLGDKDYTAAQ